MKRRHYLATSTVMAGASLGGCTRLSGEIPLGDPTQKRDEQELHLVYAHEGEEIVTISLDHSPDTPAIRRLYAEIQPSDEITLDDARFRFTPETARPAAIEIYLMPPPKGWYDEFEIYRENEGTVIEVQELGEAEFGNIGFHLLVHGELDSEGDLPPLRIEYELTLSKAGLFGESFGARGGTTIDLDQL